MALFPQTGRQFAMALGLLATLGGAIGLGSAAGQQWFIGSTQPVQVQPTNDREQLLIVVREFGVMQARLDRVEALLSKVAGKEFAVEQAVADSNTEAGLPDCDSDKIRQFHLGDITLGMSPTEQAEVTELKKVTQKEGKNTCEAIVNTSIGRVKVTYVITWSDKAKRQYSVLPINREPMDYGVAN